MLLIIEYFICRLGEYMEDTWYQLLIYIHQLDYNAVDLRIPSRSPRKAGNVISSIYSLYRSVRF